MTEGTKDTIRKLSTHSIVYRLIGPVGPIGESHEDLRRLDNLEQLGKLSLRLVEDVGGAYLDSKGKQEHSLMKANKLAEKILGDILTEIKDTME